MDSITELAARLKVEAYAAADKYVDVNAACPYPFYTQEGAGFRHFFAEAKSLQDVKEKDKK